MYKDMYSLLFSNVLFSFISSKFSPLISISFLIWSIHLVCRLLYLLVCGIFLGILSSLIRSICPNHLNLLSPTVIFYLFIPSSNLMLVFPILSFSVLLKIAQKNFISMAWILLSFLFVFDQISATYGVNSLKINFKISSLYFSLISLSLNNPFTRW